MQIAGQPIPLQSAPSPQSSTDWRFLLPVSHQSKVLVVGRKCDDYTRLFNNLEIAVASWEADFSVLPAKVFSPAIFDIVAIPLGLPDEMKNRNPQNYPETFQNLRSLLKPGGIILIGFLNSQAFQRKFIAGNYYTTPNGITRFLHRAGYEEITLYGAIPNLSAPEYLFPLTRQTIGFILEHRYRNKLPVQFLSLLHNPVITALFSYFFPAYYAVATLPII